MAKQVIPEQNKGITQKNVAQWIKEGRIQHFNLETNLRPFLENYHAIGSDVNKHCRNIEMELLKSPLAESITYTPKSIGWYTVLGIPATSYSNIYFGGLKPDKFYHVQKPGALMALLLEKKKPKNVELPVETPEKKPFFKKLFGTGKKPAEKEQEKPKVEYTINFYKSEIVINLRGTGHDGYDKRSTSWQLGIRCDSEIGEVIFAEACGSEKAAFNFFVKIIPGFEQIEGTNFDEYQKWIRRSAEFSSAKFTTREDFYSLRSYHDNILRDKWSKQLDIS